MKIEDVSAYMESRKTVTCCGCRYYISGVISRLDRKGKWYYELELHDLNANSVSIAKLNDVEEERCEK